MLDAVLALESSSGALRDAVGRCQWATAGDDAAHRRRRCRAATPDEMAIIEDGAPSSRAPAPDLPDPDAMTMGDVLDELDEDRDDEVERIASQWRSVQTYLMESRRGDEPDAAFIERTVQQRMNAFVEEQEREIDRLQAEWHAANDALAAARSESSALSEQRRLMGQQQQPGMEDVDEGDEDDDDDGEIVRLGAKLDALKEERRVLLLCELEERDQQEPVRLQDDVEQSRRNDDADVVRFGLPCTICCRWRRI